MFGSKKRKQKQTDEVFAKKLSEFAVLFESNVPFFNRRNTNEIVETVLQAYLERNPKESNYSAVDFFFDILVGNLIGATVDKELDVGTSLTLWRQSDKFLSDYQQFNSEIVLLCMNNWKSILIKRGINEMNFNYII